MAGDRARYEEALSKGHSYSWDQRWGEAIEQFQIALNEFADEPAPYAGLGMAYFELEQLEQALQNYKQAARLSQGDVIYLRQVADVQERLEQLAHAGQTYMAIGEIQLRRGAIDEAVANWHRAVRVAPNLLGAHQRLAKYYTQQGQVRAAIREYLAIARLFQARGEAERALKTCRAALNLDPRNPDILTAIELIQHGEEIYAEEEKMPIPDLDGELSATVESITGGNRASVEAAASPVDSARRLALEQLAEELFEEESAPSINETGLPKAVRDTLISQALDFQTRNKVDEAIGAYEQALDGGVRSTAARFNLGLLYQDKLRFGDAIEQFKIAVDDRQYHLASHFALGESYRARGQIDRAVEHFIAVLKIVDLGTVAPEQADRLLELYENLAESVRNPAAPEQASEFANAFVEFLSHEEWEAKVKEARERLNSLSRDRMMILGDILTAGSAQVLEALYLSQEYAGRKMIDTAIGEVYRAIALSPDYLPAHIQLGELLVMQERTAAAVDKFVTVGDTFRVRGDVNGAMSMYERVVDVSPLDLSTRSRLVEMLRQQGQIDRALTHYLAMGEAYYQLAQVDKARETYQEALKLAPRGAAEERWEITLLKRIADIDMQRFDWRSALPAYRQLRQEDPSDERTAIVLTDLYFKVGQPAYALRELDRYLKQLVASGKGAKVVGILEDMVKRYPTEAGPVQRLVHLYLAQGKRREAIERLDALGEAQLDAGENKKAVNTIAKIVELNPPNVASYQQLLKQLRAS